MTSRVSLRIAGACLALLLSLPAAARDELPGWAVPVLRLVSATHVEPITGIVVSSDGLVMVPQDFASPGDEIVVLDGGTDIIRNGRPAKIDRRLDYVGLKLIRVEGLSRRPAVWTENPPANGDSVWLAAFPPAENIAQGAQPLWEERQMLTTPGSGGRGLSFNSPLPNVTGALVDSCGYLLGISVHSGVQVMGASPDTRYRWSGEVQNALNTQQVDTRTARCEADEPLPEPEPAAEPADSPEPEPESEPEPPPEPDNELAEPEEDEQSLDDIELLPPIEPPADTGPSRLWIWLLLAAVLFAAGFGVHGWRRAKSAAEPATGSVEPGADGVDETADSTWQAPAMTHRLVLSGQDERGRAFECSCPVSDQAVNCVVGRGDADLEIEHEGIARAHARIFSTSSGLVIADLGSGAGTFVDGVPCFEGESIYVDEDSQVQLGHVRFKVRMTPADAETS